MRPSKWQLGLARHSALRLLRSSKTPCWQARCIQRLRAPPARTFHSDSQYLSTPRRICSGDILGWCFCQMGRSCESASGCGSSGRTQQLLAHGRVRNTRCLCINRAASAVAPLVRTSNTLTCSSHRNSGKNKLTPAGEQRCVSCWQPTLGRAGNAPRQLTHGAADCSYSCRGVHCCTASMLASQALDSSSSSSSVLQSVGVAVTLPSEALLALVDF